MSEERIELNSQENLKKHSLMGNHLSSVAVSLVLNTVLLVMLLFFIKFAEPPKEPEVNVKVIEMDDEQIELEDIEEEIVEEVVDDVEVTDIVVTMDPIMSEPMQSDIPNDSSTIASDLVSPISMAGLAQAMSGVRLGELGGGMTRQTQFMGTTTKGTRFAFVIDYSGSMNETQLAVMKHELYTAVKEIGDGGVVSLIFFAGPVWRPDQDANVVRKNWGGGNKEGWHLEEGAEPPNPQWILPDERNLAALQRLIYQTPKIFGTDWFPPLKEALSLEPKPDIVYFMTDGACNQTSIDKALAMVRELPSKSVQINTVVLGIDESKAPALKEIADITGGSFRSYDKKALADVATKLPPAPEDFSNYKLSYLSSGEAQTILSSSQRILPPIVEEDLVEFEL